MKKALDYVSDYELESACKDATCRAASRVTGGCRSYFALGH